MIPSPDTPERRKVILVLQTHDAEKCKLGAEGAKLLTNPSLRILQVPFNSQSSPPSYLNHIKRAGLDRPGNMLIQSPYDPDRYEEAAIATQRFAVDKYHLFAALCGHLGATEVVVDHVELSTATSKHCVKLRGERPLIGGGKLSSELEELETLAASLHMCSRFDGGKTDLKQAEGLLMRTGLWDTDGSMRALVELRGGANPLKTHKLVMNFSQETRTNLAVAGQVTVPAYISLSGDYKKITSERRDYNVSVTVTF